MPEIIVKQNKSRAHYLQDLSPGDYFQDYPPSDGTVYLVVPDSDDMYGDSQTTVMEVLTGKTYQPGLETRVKQVWLASATFNTNQ